LSLLSHDLRSALTDILGGISLLRGSELAPEIQLQIDRIEAAAGTVARLLDKGRTDDLLDIGPANARPVNINLADFLTDLKKRWGAHAAQKNIVFRVDMPRDLPAIATLDRVTLERILANLIENAIKYTDRGEVVLAVDCDADLALTFVVADTGPGLSDDALSRLFEYEGRPKDARKPGSGLGLFIAKKLSGAMAAKLTISNRNEGGAEAVLTLPKARWFERSLRRDGVTATSAHDAPVRLAGVSVLLAEDNKTNQLVATQMLQALGADYAVASDGLEALEMLEHQRFDIALLDIEMPRMSGIELMRAIRRKTGPVAEMPLVALTAYVMREHRERILAAGANGIIAKPIMDLQDLGRDVLSFLKPDGGTQSPSSTGLSGRNGDTAQAEAQAVAAGEIVDRSIVDRSIFDALIETIGPDSTAELLGKLQSDSDSVAEGLARGQKTLDLAEIRAQTHILISIAGAIGATDLQRLAQELNSAAHSRDQATIEALCAKCLSGLSDLQAFILGEQAKEHPSP